MCSSAAIDSQTLRRDLNDGPEASVDRLLEGKALAPHAASASERASASIAGAAVDSPAPDRGTFGDDPAETYKMSRTRLSRLERFGRIDRSAQIACSMLRCRRT
jgi:hypothetical protein